MSDPATIPVIVGVGQINDRPDQPGDGLDPIQLMAEALHRADADAGGGWLTDCEHLSVIGQIAWPQLAPVDGAVAERLGMDKAEHIQTSPHGDNPVRMLNEAANRIARGQATICAVTGGEALRTAGHLAKMKAPKDAPKPDALRDAPHRRKLGYAQSHGLVVPTDIYPLYENATRAAWGQSFADAQAESGAIWSRFSQVAAQNEAAWLREPKSPDEIVTTSPDNRPIAFPYTKLQVANSAVNQGAGFIVTSLAEARRRAVAEDRLAFVGAGAAAMETDDILARDRYDRSASMAASIEGAMAENRLTVGDLAHVELYSCFPCVPKMARRILGWPVDRPASVVGGLTFGGGPIGNYMSHAIARMVELLRGTDDTGLLFANGGYATHSHTIALSGAPIAGVAWPQDFDMQAEAETRRDPVPQIDESYTGPATLESFTVFYDRAGAPSSGVVVARTPDGARTLAHVRGEDGATIAALTGGDPVGRSGMIKPGDPLTSWRF